MQEPWFDFGIHPNLLGAFSCSPKNNVSSLVLTTPISKFKKKKKWIFWILAEHGSTEFLVFRFIKNGRSWKPIFSRNHTSKSCSNMVSCKIQLPLSSPVMQTNPRSVGYLYSKFLPQNPQRMLGWQRNCGGESRKMESWHFWTTLNAWRSI